MAPDSPAGPAPHGCERHAPPLRAPALRRHRSRCTDRTCCTCCARCTGAPAPSQSASSEDRRAAERAQKEIARLQREQAERARKKAASRRRARQRQEKQKEREETTRSRARPTPSVRSARRSSKEAPRGAGRDRPQALARAAGAAAQGQGSPTSSPKSRRAATPSSRRSKTRGSRKSERLRKSTRKRRTSSPGTGEPQRRAREADHPVQAAHRRQAMTRLQSRLRDERGMTLVMVATGLVAFLSATMLAVDVGMLMVARTKAQSSADAGALAGAVALGYDDFDDRSPPVRRFGMPSPPRPPQKTSVMHAQASVSRRMSLFRPNTACACACSAALYGETLSRRSSRRCSASPTSISAPSRPPRWRRQTP